MNIDVSAKVILRAIELNRTARSVSLVSAWFDCRGAWKSDVSSDFGCFVAFVGL